MVQMNCAREARGFAGSCRGVHRLLETVTASS